MGLLVDVTQVYLQLTSNDKTSIWRTPYSEKRPAGTVRTAAWLSSPFVASSLANIQWQQFRYMADAIQREDACQGELELLHGRRTARKTNAVKIATDVTQARLQVIASGNSAIWRTPYSEKRPAGTVRAAAWQTDVIQNWMRNRDVIELMLGSKAPNYDAYGLFRAAHFHNPAQYSHIVGYTSHFYAHIGAGPKVLHPPMSKLMWV